MGKAVPDTTFDGDNTMDTENTGNLDRLLGGLARGVDAVHRLPAVATLDWCDRAAWAAAALFEPALAVVTVGTLSESGELTVNEVSGVAARLPLPQADRARPVKRYAFGIRGEDGRVGTLRVRAARLKKLGIRIPFEDRRQPIAELLEDLPGAEAVRMGDLPKLWSNLEVDRVAVSVSRLGPVEAGRVIITQVTPLQPHARLTANDARVLAAFAPVLTARAELALGTEPTEQTRWLTQREQMVLDHLTLGKSVRQIADDLGRSPHTVHDHVKGLHRKLGASSRGELIARALGHVASEIAPVQTEPKPAQTEAQTVGSTGSIEPKPIRQDRVRTGDDD